MNIEEAKNHIGSEVLLCSCSFGNLIDYWKEQVIKAHKIIISSHIGGSEFLLDFLDKSNEKVNFWHVDLNKIDVRLATNQGLERNGMTIEEARLHIGAEVVLLEHTKPYMKGLNQSIANIDTIQPPSKLVIDNVSDNVVVVKSPEKHSYTINPEHIALRVIENLDVEVIVTNTPSINISKKNLDSFKLNFESYQLNDVVLYLGLLGITIDNLNRYSFNNSSLLFLERRNGFLYSSLINGDFFETLSMQKIEISDLRSLALPILKKIDTPSGEDVFLNYDLEYKKPVHEWNVDDAFYANNHGEEVEVFDVDEWIPLDEMIVSVLRGRTQFRIKPKQVFLNAGIYFEEDLVKIINDTFKK